MMKGEGKKIWIIIGWKIYWKKREELRNLMPDIFIIWSNLLLQNIFKIYFANFILGCHHHFDVLIVNVKHITKELQGFFLFAKKKKYERNLLSRVFLSNNQASISQKNVWNFHQTRKKNSYGWYEKSNLGYLIKWI